MSVVCEECQQSFFLNDNSIRMYCRPKGFFNNDRVRMYFCPPAVFFNDNRAKMYCSEKCREKGEYKKVMEEVQYLLKVEGMAPHRRVKMPQGKNTVTEYISPPTGYMNNALMGFITSYIISDLL